VAVVQDIATLDFQRIHVIQGDCSNFKIFEVNVLNDDIAVLITVDA